MERILAVKLADLGDLLTITPALRAIRVTWPEAHLAALVTPGSAALLEGSDLVDEVIPFDKFAFDAVLGSPAGLPQAVSLARKLRAARYDALLLFHHLTTRWGRAKYAALALASGAPVRAGLDNGHGGFLTHHVRDDGFGARHEVDYWLAVAECIGALTPPRSSSYTRPDLDRGSTQAGGRGEAPRLEVPITPEHRDWADEKWSSLGIAKQPAAVIHPGSGAFSQARRWPLKRFAEVARGLASAPGLGIVALAGPAPGERELALQLKAAVPGAQIVDDVPSPLYLAAFLERSALVVGNDSGVLHLAAAVERPIVAIFGPTNDHAWAPYPPDSPRHAVLSETLACRPCIHRGHAFGTPAGCPARTCLHLIQPEDVLTAARRLLGAIP